MRAPRSLGWVGLALCSAFAGCAGNRVDVFPQVRLAVARFGAVAQVALLALTVSGCASAGAFTWYKDVPNADWATDSNEYVIGVGDAISVRVYEQEGLSSTVKIRRDGQFSMPLI